MHNSNIYFKIPLNLKYVFITVLKIRHEDLTQSISGYDNFISGYFTNERRITKKKYAG